MSNLRIIGILIGIVGVLLSFRFFRGQKWNRQNFLFMLSSSFCLGLIAWNPDIVNSIQSILSLELAERGRILALLICATLVLWFVVIYNRNSLFKHSIQFDQLVRVLSQYQIKEKLVQRLSQCDICILIPAFNESENLNKLLGEIPGKIKDKKIDVLVVDDCSEDNTSEVVREKGFNVVQNPINRGGGAALRLGYDILMRAGVNICVTMDADCQHNPDEIPNLIKPILNDKADIVIGSRILGSFERDSLFRISGVYFFSFIVTSLTGLKITDPSSGFRAFNFHKLNTISLYEDQYHTSELIINAAKKGLRIVEEPITILKRKHGQSKKGKNLKYGLYFAKTILKSWWR
ncbi:MAG: glycosyltransferase family 2 protein [Deltaproteobacteria bacterium]|jgi:cellulose synthase/poly-beta-1,6-N-acetylglucosamine synthase-like glycosyltransferase|nr:glycosyltransferase family 2 protein [Deltaproteobacteria bacterium]